MTAAIRCLEFKANRVVTTVYLHPEPFDFAPLDGACPERSRRARDKQDRSEPESFGYAQGRLCGGEACPWDRPKGISLLQLQNAIKQKTRFSPFGYDVVAEPKVLSEVEGLLRMILTHCNHVDIVLVPCA